MVQGFTVPLFNTYGEKSSGIYRAAVAGHRGVELVFDLKTIPHAETLGQWFTLDPEGSPLLLHDSIRKIYALDLQYP